jgi:hypothetical protein
MDESIEKIGTTSTLYRSDENSKLNTADDSIDNIENLEQIDLKVEREEIFSKSDFYSNPIVKNTKISTPAKSFNISYKYKKLGNTFSFWYNQEGVPLIVIGPHCKINIMFIFRAVLFMPIHDNNDYMLSLFLLFLGLL